jgi:hypothetical protein
MIRNIVIAAALALTAAPGALAQNEGAPKFSVSGSTLGAILDNPEGKAAFVKIFPELADNPQLDQAREMTLEVVKGFAPQAFPDDKLAELNTELAKIK